MTQKFQFSFATKTVGTIVTIFMIVLFGTKIVGSVIENGTSQFKPLAQNLVHWYDDPTGFFISYIIGYLLVWKKPLLGSIINITASLLVQTINYDNWGFIIFAGPTLVVGMTYFLHWKYSKPKYRDG